MDAANRASVGGVTRPTTGGRRDASASDARRLFLRRPGALALAGVGAAGLTLLAAAPAPVHAQFPGAAGPAAQPASMQALSRPSVTSVAMSAVRPDRGRADSDRLRASLRWDGEAEEPRDLGTPRTVAARQAFRSEMREEALHFSLTSPWANVAEPMLDDPFVREEREDAARDILGDAAEEALATLLFGRRFREKAEVHVLALSQRGLRIDDKPSWTLRRQTDRSTARLDVPLTPSSIRFRYLREPAHRRAPDRYGTSIAIDPWDEEARVVFSVEF